MFKCQEDTLAVLGVGVEQPYVFGRSEGLIFNQVSSGRRATSMLRLMNFDLMLVGPNLRDQSVWEFLRAVKIAQPWQKWALVGEGVTEQIETTARMFGCIKVYDSVPSTDELFELTSRLRQQAARALVNGTVARTNRPMREMMTTAAM